MNSGRRMMGSDVQLDGGRAGSLGRNPEISFFGHFRFFAVIAPQATVSAGRISGDESRGFLFPCDLGELCVRNSLNDWFQAKPGNNAKRGASRKGAKARKGEGDGRKERKMAKKRSADSFFWFLNGLVWAATYF
jgi:hypothetical protein